MRIVSLRQRAGGATFRLMSPPRSLLHELHSALGWTGVPNSWSARDGYLIVTESRLPVEAVSLSVSSWTGVLVATDDGHSTWHARDLSVILGARDVAAEYAYRPQIFGPHDLTAAVTAALAFSPPFTVGTINEPGGTISYTRPTATSPAEALDLVCDLFGNCGWRANPDATVDAGPLGQLFSNTAVAVVSPHQASETAPVGAVRGLRGTVRAARDSELITQLVGAHGAAHSSLPGGVTLHDTFNEGADLGLESHEPNVDNIGTGWWSGGTTWDVESSTDTVKQVGTAGTERTNVDSGMVNHRVTAVYDPYYGTGNDAGHGIACRGVGGASTTELRFLPKTFEGATATVWKLVRGDTGGELANGATDVTNGATVKVEMMASGDDVVCLIDGEVIIRHTLTGTPLSLYGEASGNTYCGLVDTSAGGAGLSARITSFTVVPTGYLYNSIASGTSVSRDPVNGTELTLRRMVDMPRATTTGELLAAATAHLEQFERPREAYDVTVQASARPHLFIQPGNRVLIENLSASALDTANHRYLAGRDMFPVRSRVVEMEYPVPPEAGVYLGRHNGTSLMITPIHDWLVWDRSPARLRLAIPPYRGEQGQTAGVSARFYRAIAERVDS